MLCCWHIVIVVHAKNNNSSWWSTDWLREKGSMPLGQRGGGNNEDVNQSLSFGSFAEYIPRNRRWRESVLRVKAFLRQSPWMWILLYPNTTKQMGYQTIIEGGHYCFSRQNWKNVYHNICMRSWECICENLKKEWAACGFISAVDLWGRSIYTIYFMTLYYAGEGWCIERRGAIVGVAAAAATARTV